MKKLLFAVLCVMTGVFCAAAYPTLTWTGEAGDAKWLTPGNWTSDSGTPDPTEVNNYRFVDVPDNTTITIDSALVVNDITVTNTTDQVRNLKISSTKNIKNNSTSCFYIYPKSVLDFNCTAPNPWGATYNGFTLRGGGTLKFTAVRESWGGNASIYSSTFYLGVGGSMTSGMGTIPLTLYDGAVFDLGCDGYVKNLQMANNTPSTIKLNGHKLICSATAARTIRGSLLGDSASWMVLNGPFAWTFATDMSMNGTYEIRNSALELGASASQPAALAADANVDMYSHGALYVRADQSIGVLSGRGVTAFVDVPADVSFTVNGAQGPTNSTYAARLSGAGDFVKKGANYALAMSGNSFGFTGKTTVDEGSLVLSRPFEYADDIVGYWPFDGDNYLADEIAGVTWSKYYTYGVPSKKAASGVSGDSIEISEASGIRAQIDTTVASNLSWMRRINATNFTVSVWIKPADTNRNNCGEFFNFGGWPTDHVPDRVCLLGFSKNGANEYIRGYSANPEVKLAKSITDGEWHHIVYVHEAHRITVWVDGVEGGSYVDDAKVLYVDVMSMQIGGKDQWGLRYIGGMDELIIANGSWDEARIVNEYKRVRRVAEPAPLPTPAAKWTFDEDFIDEIGGVELVNAGTTAVSPTTATGAYGKCIQLNTAAKYLTIKDGDAYPFPTGRQAFTVSLRVRYQNAQEYTHVFNFGDTSQNNKYFASGFIQSCRCNSLDWNKTGQKSASLYVTDQFNNDAALFGWDHIVATYDGTSVRMYRDGRAIGSPTTAALDLTDGPFYLGYYPEHVEGKTLAGAYVDDLRVWTNCCFTAEQVAALARTLETGVDGGQLANSPVTVKAGATVRAVGTGNAVKTLAGAGTLEIARDSALTSGGGTFTGALTGDGRLTLTGSVDFSAVDASGFSGYLEVKGGAAKLNSTFAKGQVVVNGGSATGTGSEVVVEEGATITLDVAQPTQPVLSTTGDLVLPSALTIALGGESDDDFVIASAGRILMPASTANWTLPEDCRVRVRGNELQLVRRRGLVMIFR